VVSDFIVVLPESLSIESDVSVENRARGIYKARVLHSNVALTGEFVVPPRVGISEDRVIVAWEKPWLAFGVTDTRGLRRLPSLSLDGQALPPAPGTRVEWLGPGFSADVAWEKGTLPPRAKFSATMQVLGTQALSFVPLGKDTRAHMRSDWPHPSFTGRFLPDDREVSAKGFDAHWQLSRLATGLEVGMDPRLPRTERGFAAAFGTSFLEPVDVYRMSERAVKYGLLFVLLTFVAFFLFEVLRRMAVHPIQYGLVGVALALFFLLLLSLSEHVPFIVAYLIASAACVGLVAYYVGHVLKSMVRGLAFGGALTVLYAVLYVLLQSEDYALLLGAILLFGVLALVMVATRQVDWYRLSEQPIQER
jgi:inner membrane protein